MATPDGFFDMKSTAKQSGLSPSVIRMWELRYRWPNPRRMSNGYRIYTPAQIEELRRVGQLVRSGTPISQLVDKDGCLSMPRTGERRSTFPQLPITTVQTNVLVTEESDAVRSELLAAFATLNAGRVVAVLARADQAHPRVRRAAWWVVTLAMAEIAADGRAVPDVDRIVAALCTSTRDEAAARRLIAEGEAFVRGAREQAA